jgi:hypothetical protein
LERASCGGWRRRDLGERSRFIVSDLPDSVQRRAPELQSALVAADPDSRRQLIAWGYRQIDAEFPLDPIRAPLNAVRRRLAILAWEKAIRDSGAELRRVVVSQAPREVEFQIQRRQNEILADDAERRQRAAERYASQRHFEELQRTSRWTLDQQKELLKYEHDLTQSAEDAASRRRKEELLAEAEQERVSAIIDHWIATSGGTSVDDAINATNRVNQEISRIRRDPNLSTDEQHLHIKTLLDTLPSLLRNLRAHDG